jgi:simple sugar transport system permease protein
MDIHGVSHRFTYGINHRFIPQIKKFVSRREGPLAIVIILLIAFSRLYAPNFLTQPNIYTMFKTLPEFGVASLGVAFLMISGEFDLSVGSVFCAGPYVMALLSKTYNVNAWIAFIIGLLFGASIGALNGLITTRFRIPSFIVTLGGLWMWRGVILVISSGFPIPFTPPPAFQAVLTAGIGPFISAQLLWFVGVAVLLYILLDYHKFGNWVYTTGGNRPAAEARGINTATVKLINFIISGILAALGGAFQMVRMSLVTVVQGQGLELRTIAASVVGGISLLGGVGSIGGAALGVLLLAMLDRLIILAGISGFWLDVFIGIAIIAAVISQKLIVRGKEG